MGSLKINQGTNSDYLVNELVTAMDVFNLNSFPYMKIVSERK